MTKKLFIAMTALATLSMTGCKDESAKVEEPQPGQFEYLKTAYKPNKPITGDYDHSLAVKCVNGTFVGQTKDDVLSFRGIPFVGEQPIGKNRFKAPVPFREDNGVYEAYYNGKSCIQAYSEGEPTSNYEMGEDCLFLNVWKNTKDQTPKKPVMVWIHGGAWSAGGSVDPLYDGHNFIQANGDVILVSIAYRLGLLGYMHLSHLPGGEAYPDAQNNGVLDQMMALRWVHENIAAFGGDPDNVTIFGESAGAGSCSVLALIPEARKYFHRVITQSGSAYMARTTEMAEEYTRAAFEAAGVKTVAEFTALPAEKIIEAANAKFLRTLPERDGKLLPSEPFKYIESGALAGLEYLQGSNRDEMNTFLWGMGFDRAMFVGTFKPLFEEKLKEVTPEQSKRAYDFINETDGDECAKWLAFSTQVLFGAPALHQAESLSKAGNKVFHYFFRAESSIPGMAAAHCVEIAPVFNNLDNLQFTGRRFDEKFARSMQRMWVNFAKTGNPSLTAKESPTGQAITWEQYNSTTKPVMALDEQNIHMSTANELRMTDWERIYPLTDYYWFLPK